jgi:uncharacterized protein
MDKVDKKPLFLFLGLTFGATIMLLVIARLSGFNLFEAPSFYSQMVVMTSMFVPALSAFVVQKHILKKPLRELGFKIGPWAMYAKTYFVILALFTANYAITWIFFVKPDPTLVSFMEQFNLDMVLPMPASRMILIFTFMTFIAAPIINMLPSIGEEIGWRGFLLPALEPLGKAKAAVISGLVWGLWHTPMIIIIGFFYGRQFLIGSIFHLIMVSSLGVWFAYVWFKTRSTIQAAFMHAVFNANSYGIWSMLFVSPSKLLVGAGGIVGVVLTVVLGAASLRLIRGIKTE